MEIMTFNEFKNGKGFWADRDLFIKDNPMPDDAVIVNFAYTDYGGDFFDRVAIEYFKEEKEACFAVQNTSYFGKNAILFGQTAIDFIEANKDYPLGYSDIEDYYYQKTYEAEIASFSSFLDDLKGEFDMENAMKWMTENRGGYYSVQPSGYLDFCYSTMEEDLIKAGILIK